MWQLPLLKTCRRCGETKPNTCDFFPIPSTRPAMCKACVKEKRNAYSREYSRSHHEYMARKQRAFHRRNPGKGREYYANNPEYFREKQRALRRNNPEYSREKGREYGKVRREREKMAEGRYTTFDVIAQYNRQKGRCFWCSNLLTDLSMHVDHIIPLSRHGTNWPANIVCCCEFCNSSKSNSIPFEEWIPPNPLGR